MFEAFEIVVVDHDLERARGLRPHQLAEEELLARTPADLLQLVGGGEVEPLEERRTVASHPRQWLSRSCLDVERFQERHETIRSVAVDEALAKSVERVPKDRWLEPVQCFEAAGNLVEHLGAKRHFAGLEEIDLEEVLMVDALRQRLQSSGDLVVPVRVVAQPIPVELLQRLACAAQCRGGRYCPRRCHTLEGLDQAMHGLGTGERRPSSEVRS